MPGTMVDTYISAEAFPPGEYLREELDERGWTVTEFAEIIGRPVQAVSEILNNKKEITTETAMALSEGLCTTRQLWLNLQTAFRLYKQRSHSDQEELTPVARRARLRGMIPLAKVRARGWVPNTSDLDVLESAVCDLLEIDSLSEEPQFAVAAKCPDSDDPITLEQRAWLAYVRQAAGQQDVGAFNVDGLGRLSKDLPSTLKDGPSELQKLPGLLAGCGVRIVFAEGLPGGELDGAVTFLPDGKPVIGLTTRKDRFDSLLFALLHECAHLTLGHITAHSGAILDDDLMAPQSDPNEQEANKQALAWLFPNGLECEENAMTAILETPSRCEVHPSVVIGRIQHETNNFSRHRTKIPKVRPHLQASGLLS